MFGVIRGDALRVERGSRAGALFFNFIIFILWSGSLGARASRQDCEAGVRARRLGQLRFYASQVSENDHFQPEPGSIFESHPAIHQGMLNNLRFIRKVIDEVNGKLVKKQITAAEIYERGITLRREVSSQLAIFQAACHECLPFLRELQGANSHIRATTETLVLNRNQEIEKLEKAIELFGSQVQILRNLVGDILGQVGELFVFGMLNDPVRGVRVRSYLAALYQMSPKNLANHFVEAGIETRLLDKEIDLMTPDEDIWVEVKAFDSHQVGFHMRQKLIKQLKDHLMLMKQVAKGVGQSMAGKVRRLRYFSIGEMSEKLRRELVEVARAELEILDATFGGPTLQVEFTSISLKP
jgi:hypothetical protein